MILAEFLLYVSISAIVTYIIIKTILQFIKELKDEKK